MKILYYRLKEKKEEKVRKKKKLNIDHNKSMTILWYLVWFGYIVSFSFFLLLLLCFCSKHREDFLFFVFIYFMVLSFLIKFNWTKLIWINIMIIFLNIRIKSYSLCFYFIEKHASTIQKNFSLFLLL